jgi:uncharacterized protein involved in exopolysaccharide biosynthesis
MTNLRQTSAISEQKQPSLAPPVMVHAMPASNPEQALFHFDFLRSLQLHRRLAIGIFVSALALAAGYVLMTWPIYNAQSLVYIQPAPPRLMDSGLVNRWPFDANTYETYIQQQIHNITRPDVLVGALHKLPAGSWRRAAETEQAAADRLGRAITVTRVGTGYQVSIAARASNAALAAEMSNAVSSSFIESATRELRSGDTQRIELLREERDRVSKELAADRAEQEDLNKKLGVAAIGTTTPDPFDEQISQIRLELVKARTANDEAAARLTSMASGNSASSAGLDAAADEIVAVDAGMVSMKTSLNQRRSVLITQMANLTPNHPQYKQDAEELAQINASLDSMTKDLRSKAASHIQQRLKSDLERTSGVEAKLNAQLAQLTAAAGGATPRLQRSNELVMDIQRLQNRYGAVDEQFRNLTMENNAPGAVYLSSAAVPPLHASDMRVLRNAMVLVLAGLLLGIAAALTAQNLDPHIYIAADVERVLGFAPMAQLPDFQQVSDGVAEEYMLRLAAAVEHAYQQGGMQSCIFTGIAPGSGVTTVATRVRTMLEAMGRATVLVDASGTPPPVTAADGSTGLVTTQFGSRPTVLLQQMAEENGKETIVLTDTAPLLVSGETEYLARFVDSAIVVIESGVTTRAQLHEVARTLQRLEVAAVGFVLNRIALANANSSFRNSVRAVEQHLHTQTRSNARGTVRSQPSAQPEREAPPEPASAAQRQPATPETHAHAAAASPSPFEAAAPVANAPSAAPAPEPWAAPDVTSFMGASRLTPRPLRRESAPPETATAVFDPAPPPPPQTPQPMPQTRYSPPPPVEWAVPPSPPAPAAVPTPAAAAYQVPKTPPPPAAPAYRAPEQRRTPASAPVPEPAPRFDLKPVAAEPADEMGEGPYSAASRLGGLRTLLVSLGLKSLDKESDFRDREPEAEVRYEREPERTVYAQPFASVSPVNADAASPSTAAVIAQPEFLPPRPVVEVAEREKEPARPVSPPARHERWESMEDVQTLPSWRGQYRKKRS